MKDVAKPSLHAPSKPGSFAATAVSPTTIDQQTPTFVMPKSNIIRVVFEASTTSEETSTILLDPLAD